MESFATQDVGNKLQSIIAVNGGLSFEIKGQDRVKLKEKEYLLFNTAGHSSLTTVHKGRSSILNAHYASDLYRDLLPYFIGLKDDLKKVFKKSYFLEVNEKGNNCSLHDTIEAIWKDKCIPALQAKHIELRLESSLFKMLAESYEVKMPSNVSASEQKLAIEAEKIILRNLKVHLTPKEIAIQLNCSASTLRKAFSKVHKIPMFKFLRTARMHYAREQILNGASLKSVSIELGINPSNFPKEFKAFFGYTVSSLKKGLH